MSLGGSALGVKILTSEALVENGGDYKLVCNIAKKVIIVNTPPTEGGSLLPVYLVETNTPGFEFEGNEPILVYNKTVGDTIGFVCQPVYV